MKNKTKKKHSFKGFLEGFHSLTGEIGGASDTIGDLSDNVKEFGDNSKNAITDILDSVTKPVITTENKVDIGTWTWIGIGALVIVLFIFFKKKK